jgi:hypothetical protein
MLPNSQFLLPDTNSFKSINHQKEQNITLLTALGGLFERVGKTASILINSRLVRGFEFGHSSGNWLLA